jgi:hypothetical protein
MLDTKARTKLRAMEKAEQPSVLVQSPPAA